MTELKNNYSDFIPEVGCDEAGRGCLAGPVFAAAIVLPNNFYHPDLNDSKQVSLKKRLQLKDFIEANAIAWAVAEVDNNEIDKINILNASILAMHRAIDKLTITPKYIIVDGNKFKPYKEIPYTTIVKGDGKFCSIAAASILAKTHRDLYMEKLNKEFPQYLWNKNKGYPTLEHKNAIHKFGITPYHRITFKTSVQLKLDL